MNSKKFNKVLTYYKNGNWSKEWVKNAVIKRWITEEEYKIITGEDFYDNF